MENVFTVQQVMDQFPDFNMRVPEDLRLTNDPFHTLQVNIGYKCNLSCKHCHLQCGPNRTEMASHEVLQACVDACRVNGFANVDVTGGAIELHTELEWFLREIAALGVHLIVRTNLALLSQPEYQRFAQLYAELDADIYASLPYYSARNVDKIRGTGTFAAAIEGLRLLNECGYGTGKHTIVLVYNPAGAMMPPNQVTMQAEYKRRLPVDFGVDFDQLVAITNNPCGRFAEALNNKGNLAPYMQKLIDAFNPATVEAAMCRDQVSVDWQGNLYDCDFNQALGIGVASGETIFDLAQRPAKQRRVIFRNHCYACTAGAGSSCGGTTA